MSLTVDDKQWIESRFTSMDELIKEEALKREQFESDVRGMYADIKAYMHEIPKHRARLDDHDIELAILKRAAFGHSSDT